MPNEQNLVPNSERTPSERREIAAAGGRASGVSRRRKRALKEAADLFLSLPVSDKRSLNRLVRKGIDPEDVDNQMAMIVGLVEAATEGDARAGKLIVDILGVDEETIGSMSREDDPLTASLREAMGDGAQ